MLKAKEAKKAAAAAPASGSKKDKLVGNSATAKVRQTTCAVCRMHHGFDTFLFFEFYCQIGFIRSGVACPSTDSWYNRYA